MMTTSNLTSILSYCFLCTQENLENKALKLEARDYSVPLHYRFILILPVKAGRFVLKSPA
jgi:hypothetical protein